MWIQPDNIFEITNLNQANLMDLHERYGHVSFDTFLSLPEAQKIENPEKQHCDACAEGKSVKPASRSSRQPIRTTRVLEQVHIDLMGPLKE